MNQSIDLERLVGQIYKGPQPLTTISKATSALKMVDSGHFGPALVWGSTSLPLSLSRAYIMLIFSAMRTR